MSDWRVKQVSDLGRVGGISIHKSSAEESANPEDESEAFVPDVACHNKSAGFLSSISPSIHWYRCHHF